MISHVANDPRALDFSWDPPGNGVITGYLLTCDPQPEGFPKTCYQSEGVKVTLNGFIPSTSYYCTVYASNSAENGQPASDSVITGDDCKLIMVSSTCITCEMLSAFL